MGSKCKLDRKQNFQLTGQTPLQADLLPGLKPLQGIMPAPFDFNGRCQQLESFS